MSRSQSKIRILFLCHDAKPYGAQRSLQLMVENLPRDQYELFVSFERDGELAEHFKTLPHVTVLYSKRMHAIRHHQRGGLNRILDALGVLFTLPRGAHLAVLCRQHQIDLIHSNTLVSLSGGVAARLAGIPHVWHIREWFERHNSRMQLILGKALTKWAVHYLSDVVLSVSTLARVQFSPYTSREPGKYRVFPNVVDYQKLDEQCQTMPENKNPAFGLVYLGRISDGKRFQDIIDALCLIRKERGGGDFPLTLHAYGHFISPEFEQRIRRQIEAHDLGSYVHFPGYEDDLARCFAGAHLLLNPSTNESFGRTLIEAMAFGLPVLAARSGGPTEIIQDGKTGLFYMPESPQDLARQLRYCVENPDRLRAMGEAGRDDVRAHYDITVQVRQLDALYRSLVGR